MTQERTERQAAIEMIDAEIKKTVRQMVEIHKSEIDRLNTTIAGLQEAVKEQTAKVQERDTYIAELEKSLGEEAERNRRVQSVLAKRNRNLETRIEERDKEIAAIESVRKKDKEFFRSQIEVRDQAIAEVKRQRDEADIWLEHWRREAFRHYPIQEAYNATRVALEKHRARADAAEKEIERLTKKEGQLIHEARGASEAALKEAEENVELREEIERLRAGLSEAQVNVQHIRRIADFGSYTEKYAMVALGAIDSALKGAE